MTGHLMVIKNPLSHLHILPPEGGCGVRVRTTITARAAGCVLATNAGFFNVETGACIGNLISNGKVIEVTDVQKINFGVIADSFVAGYVNESMVTKTGFKQLVAGAVWLVRDGVKYVDISAKKENVGHGFIVEIAPRLAIGWNSKGEFLILEVNGLEFRDQGYDLYQMADLSIKLGFENSINLDGGGSVTVDYNGVILNTCSDNCTPSDKQYACPAGPTGTCERSVTSIICVM
eukprot:TRINITY_DN9767_c0_g1_i2.p1 TRINITY_DN9767_c0_g1~~TRINITY_DN9767_c0_g1_i2.p1  ORF type:complete len:233 (+),score=37.04 TRINITY_DN9767_c0_g1_i2:53-751(+)